MFTVTFFSKFTNMMMKSGNKVLSQEILAQVRKELLKQIVRCLVTK